MNKKTAVATRNAAGELAFPNKMPAALEIPTTPPTKVRALTFWLFLMGFGIFGGFGFWASVSSIQSAVVASGTFEVEGDLRTVNHLEGGVIRAIHVQEGDFVDVGDAIIELDGTRQSSQMGILLNQLVAALAREARLSAEAQHAAEITFGEELLSLIEANPSFQQIVDAQRALFESNQNSDLGEVSIFDERIGQLNEQLAGIDGRREMLKRQLLLVDGEVASLEELFEKGLTRKSRLVARQENQIVIGGRIGQAEADRQSVLQQIAEVRQRLLQVDRERRLTIAGGQHAVAEQIYDIRQRIATVEEIMDRLVVRAPVAGQIVGFKLNTIGATIESGEELLKIVPHGQAHIVEAQVATSDIDEVVLGGAVRVRLSAYSFRKTPPVNGEVSYISADAFFDTSTDTSFYRINVAIPEAEMDALPDVRALPGMPVQVMMATGEQTVLNYLLDPVLGGLETAMVEGE